MNGERYRIGERVKHEVFGFGTIKDKYNNSLNKVVLVVKFDSLETNRNIVAGFYGIRRAK